jgi:hypothetical protein
VIFGCPTVHLAPAHALIVTMALECHEAFSNVWVKSSTPTKRRAGEQVTEPLALRVRVPWAGWVMETTLASLKVSLSGPHGVCRFHGQVIGGPVGQPLTVQDVTEWPRPGWKRPRTPRRSPPSR